MLACGSLGTGWEDRGLTVGSERPSEGSGGSVEGSQRPTEGSGGLTEGSGGPAGRDRWKMEKQRNSPMWYHRSLAPTGAAAQKWGKGNAGQLKQRFCTDSACFRTSRTDRPTDRQSDIQSRVHATKKKYKLA